MIDEERLPVKIDASGGRLQALQDKFENCKLIVIDEKSFIGCFMLYMIHKRLTEAKPISGVDPRRGLAFVIDEERLPVKIDANVPTFGQRTIF